MKRLDNKGLTLVELVIAIAISSMIVGAASMFLYNAERTYRVAEHSINLQMEAQILMEQMSNWVMEGNRVLYFQDMADLDGDGVRDNGPEDMVLVIYYIPRDNAKNVNEIYPSDYSYNSDDLLGSRRIIFTHDGKLYMKEEERIGDAVTQYKDLLNNITSSTGTIPVMYTAADVEPTTSEKCIGEFVYRFNVDKAPSDVDMSDLSSVSITLGMIEGKQSYTMMDTFTLRNGLHLIPTPEPTTAPEDGG